MKYRTLKPNEYKMLSVIHELAFKDFFLTSLGMRFLETYYKACLKSNDSIAVCAVNENNEIMGFATGSVIAKAYHKKLFLQNLFSFAYRGIVIAITTPNSLIRLMKNIDKNANPVDDRNYSELLSIAVLPEQKGSGMAKKLLKYFEKEALNRGANRVALTTDINDNDRVVAFYKKCEYRIYYDFCTYPNRRMYKMIKDLNNIGNETTL